MTKVVYSSDIHLNQNILFTDKEKDIKNLALRQGHYLNKINASHYIINGDITWDFDELNLYLTTLKEKFKGEVYRTLGNHCLSKNYSLEEYINFDSEDYLPTHPIILDDMVIIGNSGFFDFTYSYKFSELSYINDTLLREVQQRYFKGETLSYSELREIVPELLEQSQNIVDEIDFEGKKKVFVTHYMPHKQFLSTKTDERTLYKNAFMGSNKISNFLEKNNFDVCYFGHTHRRIPQTKINNILYRCNPVGTMKEWEHWGYANLDLYDQWKSTLLEIK